MLKCLTCKKLVQESDWQKHVKAVHGNARKVPFKKIDDDQLPRERQLVDALPSSPSNANVRAPPTYELPLDDPDYQPEENLLDLPHPPNLYLPLGWFRRNMWALIKWMFVITTLLMIVLVIASKTRWSLPYLKSIFESFWQWLRWVVLGSLCLVSDSFNDVVLHQNTTFCSDWGIRYQALNVTDHMHRIEDAQNLLLEAFKTAYMVKFKESFDCEKLQVDCLSNESINNELKAKLNDLPVPQQVQAADRYILKLADCKTKLIGNLKKYDDKITKEQFVSGALTTLGTCNLKQLD